MARVLWGVAAAVGLLAGVEASVAQDLKPVPRNRTLISQGWDFYNQVPSPTSMSPYAGLLLHQRNSLHYTVNEPLFFTNHMTNEIIPWQAESFAYDEGFRTITLKLRDTVKWSDGQPFTAEDVVFTVDMLKSVAPDLLLSAAIKEWIARAEAPDPRTVRITLTKPGPRFVQDFLAQGQAARFIVVPKHIWTGQDPKTFSFFDLQKGWPVGTGPYKLVKSDASSIVYDRRESWWAAEAGVAKGMPAVERVIYKPATVDAVPQLFTNNEIDIGRALQVGAFEAGKARNPGLSSWNASGPVWGAPDGCTFRLILNTQRPPFDDADVRRAINHAINRDQIVNLAYEGSMPKAVWPFSSYGGVVAYTAQMKDLLAESGIDKADKALTEKLLTGKKFVKGADGQWAKPGGEAWPFTIIMQQGNPSGPVVVQQLKSAGFNVVFQALQDAAHNDAMATGNFDASLTVHCGSVYDPWQTLEHFHGKYAAAAGQKVTNPRSYTRYSNPELDAVLNKMEAVTPSPKDPAYMALVRDATRIFLRDLPEITLAEEFHVVTNNTTYWTGFPTAADPYVAPYLPWEGFALVVHRLKPRS
ncbi:ABC transporter substrate-binding protein [Prosthecomicrobium sp. N25]|uniref:ABC transporter substrate-binding protein n=1 Tax=Prosthecomicrobium sp. N25 TaxID=3129254 RepID=UPI003076D3B3